MVVGTGTTNVIVIHSDDHGTLDAGCYGSADIAVWRAGAIHLLSSPGYIEVARAWIDAARAIATNDPVLEKLNEALGQRAAVEVAR